MLKIGDITDTADGNGEFTDGNVAGNIQPTELMGQWFTTVQRELIAVLTAAEMQTDKTNDAQLVSAIKNIVAANISLQYPVGCVMWFVKNKNPNDLFPGTTWLYLGENKTIRLAKEDGSDVATTGGADTVTLAVGNIPAHGHAFSANTSRFDYGTKTTSSFNYGTKTTNTTGNHVHSGALVRAGGSSVGSTDPYTLSRTGNTGEAGTHAHTVAIGAHAHTVGIGAHTHSVSGTTANTGFGSAVSVTNSFIKLMGWYRSA